MASSHTYSVSFKIRELPQTYNQLNRKHYRAKCAEAKKWQRLVLEALPHLPLAPLKKAHLKLTRYSSSEPDYDGLTISFKYVVDALVLAKVIDNDKLSNTGPWEVHWVKVPPKKGGISVEVQEATNT
jgi:hypothetical protein